VMQWRQCGSQKKSPAAARSMLKESSAAIMPTKDKIFALKIADYVVGVPKDGASPKKTRCTEEVEHQGSNDNDLDKKPTAK
jgi:hypothetical protein